MGGPKKDSKGTLRERFERKYIPEPNSGCWLWIGALGGQTGRAMIGMDRKVVYASHVSWLLFKSDLPRLPGDQILHTCDMPSCVNPDHLWLGSQLDNVRDCKKKGRLKRGPGYTTIIGEQHYNAKLTEADVIEIRTGLLNYRDYAQKFGVSADYVHQIQRGRTWKHLA